jgi:hypothetical protein
VKHQLRHAVTIAQVNEAHTAQVAAAMHPTHQQRAFTRVGGAQLPAAMCAAKLAKKV